MGWIINSFSIKRYNNRFEASPHNMYWYKEHKTVKDLVIKYRKYSLFNKWVNIVVFLLSKKSAKHQEISNPIKNVSY